MSKTDVRMAVACPGTEKNEYLCFLKFSMLFEFFLPFKNKPPDKAPQPEVGKRMQPEMATQSNNEKPEKKVDK